MTGSTLGKSSLRVLPSKTAIVPVNKELMPRSEEELERCSRTVYVANIDKKVEREDVRAFFEKLCGESAACCAKLLVGWVGWGGGGGVAWHGKKWRTDRSCAVSQLPGNLVVLQGSSVVWQDGHLHNSLLTHPSL